MIWGYGKGDHRGQIERGCARIAKKQKRKKERQHAKRVVQDPEIQPEVSPGDYDPVKFWQGSYSRIRVLPEWWRRLWG